MAIFGNSDNTNQNAQPDKGTTIITEGSKIKGDMELTCNLYVDGEFEGTINSQKNVNIGKNGHIKGDIKAQRLVIQGYIEGSVNAYRVEIKSTGKMNGSVESAELVIEAKGIFEGNSTIKKVEAKEPAQLSKPQ
jgi:cytoskeletal protein CcmA (bactofilin family)